VLTLALDTSTRTGSIALGLDGEVLAESRLSVRAVHSESVLPEIDRLFESAGFGPADIRRVVVGSGPGSFTGVRIAAALAKGIRAATGAELFAYSSLAAIAAGSGASGRVCAAIDARRGQVYAAGYVLDSEFIQEFEPVAEPFDTVLSRLEPPSEWTLAAAIPEALMRQAKLLHVNVLPPAAGEPGAASLLDLVGLVPELGRVEHPETWEPRYVRASSAERELAG
jgi:tRNA threonylcarbamoyladenosine biosynthesis protein TsaB